MRRMILFMMVSLDGYFEGVDHDLSWHYVDEEFNQFAIEQLKEAETLIFGHQTYDLMANYWPNADDDPEVAEIMNSYSKVVVSKTLKKADWKNTKVVNSTKDLVKLKSSEGKTLLVLGSNNLSVSLFKAGLLDELRIMINPVIVGQGNVLFADLDEKLNLKLTKSKKFKNGNVLLYYEPSF